MKAFIAACLIALAALPQQGTCDGHADEVPTVTMTMEMAVGEHFEIVATLKQQFPRYGEPSRIMVYAEGQGLESDELEGTKAYFGQVGVDCASFSLNSSDTEVEDVTHTIQIPDPNASLSAIEMDGNLFETFTRKKLVVVYNGVNYCGEFDYEVEEMKTLRLKYKECPSFDREAITKVIARELELNESKLQLGSYGNDEGCGFVDVYFNDAFDNSDLLKKAFKAFSESNRLGLFSPTDSCMTDVKASFIMEYVIKMFLASKDEKEETDMEPTKTCAGISSQLAMEYKARLAKYDMMTKAYLKKYGGNFLDEKETSMGADEPKETATPTCDYSQYGSEAVKMYMDLDVIAKYVGISLANPELEKKKTALAELVKGPYPDMETVAQMTEQIKTLQQVQDRTLWDVQFGTCMVAARPDATQKLESIKETLASVSPNMISAKADEILRELLLESIKYSLDMAGEGERELSVSVFRQKLQIIFAVNAACSTVGERKRVLDSLMTMTETLPQSIQALSEMIGVENVTMAMNEIKNEVEKDTRAAAMKIFLIMYAPIMEVEEDNPMFEKAKNLAMALKDNIERIAEKARDWAESEVDNSRLMAMQVMLLRKSDLEKGCDYSWLADMVRAKTPQPAPEDTQTSCAGDASYDQGKEEMRQGGNRRQLRRRMAPRRNYQYDMYYDEDSYE